MIGYTLGDLIATGVYLNKRARFCRGLDFFGGDTKVEGDFTKLETIIRPKPRLTEVRHPHGSPHGLPLEWVSLGYSMPIISEDKRVGVHK